jgi:lysophospholipase L1-like esterase
LLPLPDLFSNTNLFLQDNEATPGFVLTQIRSAYHNSAGYKPNVVVINGGTNDADYPVDPSTAGERMRDILDDIWNTSGMANTCVMLSTLIPSTDPNGVVNRITINAQYRDLVTELSGSKCIYLADMDPPTGAANGWISTSADMISDGIHPNVRVDPHAGSLLSNIIDRT